MGGHGFFGFQGLAVPFSGVQCVTLPDIFLGLELNLLKGRDLLFGDRQVEGTGMLETLFKGFDSYSRVYRENLIHGLSEAGEVIS